MGFDAYPGKTTYHGLRYTSAEYDHLGLVKLLLERGADVRVMNDEGRTPYRLSLQRGHREKEDCLRWYCMLREEKGST